MKHTFICTKDEAVVETKQGKLRGFYYDEVYNFWGVRYARARRFHMPQAPEAWEGVKNAMAYGHVSPLLEDPIPDFELTVPHRFWPEGEDCLNLNIATPTLEPGGQKAGDGLVPRRRLLGMAPPLPILHLRETTWPVSMTW